MEKKFDLLAHTCEEESERAKCTKKSHYNFSLFSNEMPQISLKIRNRLERKYHDQLQLIKEIIINVSVSGALSPKIAAYIIKKTDLAGA